MVTKGDDSISSKKKKLFYSFIDMKVMCTSVGDTLYRVAIVLVPLTIHIGVSLCITPFRSDLIGVSEPVPRCSFNSFYLFIYLFQKCRDVNPRPNPNGGSEPELGLLRLFSFILSKNFIYVISF